MIIIAKKLSSLFIIVLLLSSIAALDITRRYLSGDFSSDGTQIEVLYSSEKASWLESIVAEFEEDWSADNGGQSINVVMTPIGTAKGTIQIAQGAAEPTIWSPASGFWLPYLNTIVERSGDPAIVDESSPSMVVSPTVVATWRSYQDDVNITSMEDLRQLALNDPEFTFAHNDPFASNGGFTAVIMQVSAAAEKSVEELTLEDLASEKVQSWMRDLQGAVTHYGSSTGFLAKFLTSEGPDRLKAAIIYENLVVEKNKELDFRISQGDIPENQKLVAVYPEEGVLFNDHPFAIIDRPWVDDNEREVAQDFIDYLLQPEIQQRAVEYGFRPVVDVPNEILDEQFNEENGAIRSFENLTIYRTSDMDGAVVEQIPNVWSATRSRSLSDPQSTELTPGDYVLPGLLLGFFLLMVLQPVISRVRREYLA